MGFIDTAISRGMDASRIILTAATETSIGIKDGKRLILKHLLKGFVNLDSYKEAFKKEYELGCRLRHPNLLPYEEYGNKENGDPYIRMAGIHCVPFDYYLGENPAFIAQTKEISRLIGELMDAVAYLHSEGVCHWDLRPSNLLITRTQKSIMLVNPAYTYIHCKPSIIVGNEVFTAPELMQENGTPDERSDIYAIGQLICYIYANADIPVEYKAVVKKATQADPAKRYRSVEEMKAAVKRAAKLADIGKRAVYMAAFLAFFAIIWFGLVPSNDETEFITPVKNLNKDLPAGTMLNSEGFVVPDTSLHNAIELTPEQLEQQKIYQEKAEQIFKKDFAKKAEAELSKIYSSSNMNGDIAHFKDLSNAGISKLDEYQKELCEKYEMDAITGAKLASEVISTITQQKMKELEKEKQENK